LSVGGEIEQRTDNKAIAIGTALTSENKVLGRMQVLTSVIGTSFQVLFSCQDKILLFAVIIHILTLLPSLIIFGA
jgi:hypothetical protein